MSNLYRIAGKFGGGNVWRIGHLEVLARKSLANVDDLLNGACIFPDLLDDAQSLKIWRILIGE